MTRWRECRDCGLFQILPSIPDGQAAVCARCAATLRHAARDSEPEQESPAAARPCVERIRAHRRLPPRGGVERARGRAARRQRGRVLAEDVEQRLPGSSVYTEDGAITADPEATVEVDVREFDLGDQGQAHLWAEVAVERGDNHTASSARSIRLIAAPQVATTAALVATMSDLLGQLADQIAAMLRRG